MKRTVIALVILGGATRADVTVPGRPADPSDEALRVARAFFAAAARGDWSATDPLLPFRFCRIITHNTAPTERACRTLRSRAALAAVNDERYPERPLRLSLDASRCSDVAPRPGERIVLGEFDNPGVDRPEPVAILLRYVVALTLREHAGRFQVTGWTHCEHICDEDPC